ncbi:MAG: hypothetical protein KAI08_03950 [Bacteroidales bacterium]|nr:hypothetical protein [Bacteroidales bacterium]
MKNYRSIRFSLAIPLTVLLITFVSPLLLAQDTDHVYLKSGSVIRGKILEIDPIDHVKVEDMCGNIWYYKIAEVEKITSEPFEADKRRNQKSIGFDAGFVNMTSIGFLVGSSYNSQVAPFSLLMVNGYRAPSGLFAGFGTGIEFFSTSYMPFFLDLRYDLVGTDVVPYVLAKGGWSVPLSSDRTEYDISYEYSGGPLFGAGIGLKIRTRNHFAWDVELLYRYQETSYTEIYEWNNQEYDYTDIFNRIEIRLGFYID